MMRKLGKRCALVLVMTAVFLFCNGFDENQEKVVDEGNILSEHQEEELRELALNYAGELKLDLAIITFYDPAAKGDMAAYTDAWYDSCGYGYDQAGSGVLLFIDMCGREVYINTKGIAIWYIDDGDIEDILDDVQPRLITNGDYYEGCKAFLNDVRKLAKQFIDNKEEGIEVWEEGNYRDYKDFYYDYVVHHKNVDYQLNEGFLKRTLSSPWKCAIISMVLAAVAVFIMSVRQKSKMTANGENYMDTRSYDMRRKRDQYITTTTVTRKIETSSGGGGGGSFHSSGGGSHGGGGRGF